MNEVEKFLRAPDLVLNLRPAPATDVRRRLE
jgi:hypothetical protein